MDSCHGYPICTTWSSIECLSSNPLKHETFSGDVLFICGGKSGYVRSEHHDKIQQFFPNADIKILEKAGHDVHVEDGEGFLSLLQSFSKGFIGYFLSNSSLRAPSEGRK